MGERLTIILLMTIQWNEDFVGMPYRIFFELCTNVRKSHWHKHLWFTCTLLKEILSEIPPEDEEFYFNVWQWLYHGFLPL